jgi:homoserine O-succinyltransferase/O-acetyltransferase
MAPMPLLLDTAQSGSAADDANDCINVGLINNMPDAALEATERQFTDLIAASSHDTLVRLTLYRLPEVPRSKEARRDMAGRYRDVGELWDARLDGLIVTGTEPKSENLADEPYWDALAQLIDWARTQTTSTIWSCLAAHAAVLQSDGIVRKPYGEKLSGVFACAPDEAHPMTAHLPRPIRVPHSRGNDLPERALRAAGYRILTRSAAAGVDMFARQERSFHLFLQGHPEYGTTTLLREYRRDIGRYLRGERDDYPNAPRGYFEGSAAALVEAFRNRAMADPRGELLGSFPMQRLEASLTAVWRSSAVAIYERWFDYLKGRKAERLAPLVPMRRAWRDWPARAPVAAEHSAT